MKKFCLLFIGRRFAAALLYSKAHVKRNALRNRGTFHSNDAFFDVPFITVVRFICNSLTRRASIDWKLFQNVHCYADASSDAPYVIFPLYATRTCEKNRFPGPYVNDALLKNCTIRMPYKEKLRYRIVESARLAHLPIAT